MEFWTCGWNELSFWWSSRNFWILSYAASRGLASQFSALSLSWCLRGVLIFLLLWGRGCQAFCWPRWRIVVASPHRSCWDSQGTMDYFNNFFLSFFLDFFLEIWGNDEIHLRLANIFFQLGGKIPPPTSCCLIFWNPKVAFTQQIFWDVQTNRRCWGIWNWCSFNVLFFRTVSDLNVGDLVTTPTFWIDSVCIVSRHAKTCDSCCSTSHYLVQWKSYWLPTVAMKVIQKFLYQRGAPSVRPLFLHESVMSEWYLHWNEVKRNEKKTC